MAVEITPEPSEEERRAILRALELEREEAEEPAPWRRVGLGELEGAAVATWLERTPGVRPQV